MPFWCCGFIRPKGMPFEKFVPLWLRAKFTDDRIFYTPSMTRSGFVTDPGQPAQKKGSIYGKYYRKQGNLKGIEAYSPRAERVIV